jgi:hypothetical protein
VRVADAVPGRGRAWAVAELVVQHERPLANLQRPFVVTQQAMRPADRVERPRLADPVAAGLVPFERQLIMV